MLYFLHGDHLGSTSLTLDANGNKTGEMKYMPYGETRYVTGTLPTDIGYTGQRFDSYIKLVQMGARQYDPELGRWLSPDTIVPDPANPQSLNRFTYVGNSPLNRIDPSGHRDLDCMAHPGTCGRYISNPYIRFTGDWSYEQQETMIESAKIIEYRLKSADAAAARGAARGYRFEDGPVSYLDLCSICGLGAGQAWQAVMGAVVGSRVQRDEYYTGKDGKQHPVGAWTDGANNTIEFYNAAFDVSFMVQHPLHEFGHLFAWHANGQQPYRDIQGVTVNIGRDYVFGGQGRTSLGYQTGRNNGNWPWQQHSGDCCGEDFADMFLNWNLQSFAPNDYGQVRYDWMNANMPRWIALTVNGN